VALQQHLADPRGEGEVPIDLEWRMGIKKVGINAAARAVADACLVAYRTQ